MIQYIIRHHKPYKNVTLTCAIIILTARLYQFPPHSLAPCRAFLGAPHHTGSKAVNVLSQRASTVESSSSSTCELMELGENHEVRSQIHR